MSYVLLSHCCISILKHYNNKLISPIVLVFVVDVVMRDWAAEYGPQLTEFIQGYWLILLVDDDLLPCSHDDFSSYAW
jgi:hypothetical protein